MEFADPNGIVIVGAGMAGVTVAKEVRRLGYPGPVRLISEETEPPYDRPPLSKQFLVDGNHQAITLVDAGLDNVELIPGKKTEGLDCAAKRIRFQDGSDLAYGRLVLATGTSPRTLPSLLAARLPVLTLRTLGDARRIREHLKSGARLVVVGGGPIGLELAATAQQLGVHATVIEASPRLMSRSSPVGLAQSLFDHHTLKGIHIVLNRVVARIAPTGVLTLDDGTTLQADVVVIGIGVVANDQLASTAGIAANDGIFVDGYGRSTAPDVYAAGDVTRQLNVFSGRFERIETWSNASGQGASLARNLVLLHPAEQYRAVPWFWSDQGEARSQVAGDVSGSNEIMLGDFRSGKGVSVHLRDGTVVGVAALNSAKIFNLARRLIAARARVSREQLLDPQFDFKEAVQKAEAEARRTET